jgi:hypothetical protein
VQRERGRDLATGIVLSHGDRTRGAVPLPRHDPQRHHRRDATDPLRFDLHARSLDGPLVVVMSVVTLVVIALIYRPLLLSSTQRRVGRGARGRGARRGTAFMLAIGRRRRTLLDRHRLDSLDRATHRSRRDGRAGDEEPARALIVAGRSSWGSVTTWLGVLLAYDSFYWFPSSQGLPVSFFIVSLIFLAYLASGTPLVLRVASDAPTSVGRLMFSGFMVNAWLIGTIVAVVAGVVGFFVVLRGSAFPAHAIPNGAFAGAAGANLIGINPLDRSRGLFPRGGAGHRSTRASRARRRRDGPGAGDDAGARGRLPQPEHRVRAGDLLACSSARFWGERGQFLPVALWVSCASWRSASSIVGCS